MGGISSKQYLLVFALVVLIFIVGCQASSSPSGQVTASKCKETQVPYESQEEYVKTEYYSDTVPYTDKECDTKKLVYSITDFTLDSSTCNNQEEVCHKSYPVIGCTDKTVYCTDRTVVCSLTINNLDDENGGWNIKFNFNKVGSNSYAATDTATSGLYPHTSKSARGIGRISNREVLETSYTCSYNVINEPTKEVCRDVIKYREVQKERQVTAYRPVTKYRTEKSCE